MSPPISAPAKTRALALGSRATARTASASGRFADQRNSVYGDVFTANVVAVRFRDGPDGHLPDLGTTSHDNDALAVDLLERIHQLHVTHNRQFLEVFDQSLRPDCNTTSKYVRASSGRFSRISTELISPSCCAITPVNWCSTPVLPTGVNHHPDRLIPHRVFSVVTSSRQYKTQARMKHGAHGFEPRCLGGALLPILASGTGGQRYLAVPVPGNLDTVTIMLTAAGLLLRGLLIYGFVQFDISERSSTLVTVGYTGFYILDYFVFSREFLTATVHLVFFLAVVKNPDRQNHRDHRLHRRDCVSGTARGGHSLYQFQLLHVPGDGICDLPWRRSRAARSGAPCTRPPRRHASGSSGFRHAWRRFRYWVTAGILALTGGLFFLLPRTADAAFSRVLVAPHPYSGVFEPGDPRGYRRKLKTLRGLRCTFG